MAKQRRAWMAAPVTKTKAALHGTLKDEMDTKAKELIERVLKPKHIQPPPEGCQFNYITDITARWIGSTCYFISIYACPGPNAIAPTFEEKFARTAWVGDAKFNLSYMRHTGKWVQFYTGISVDECLKTIQDNPWFQP